MRAADARADALVRALGGDDAVAAFRAHFDDDTRRFVEDALGDVDGDGDDDDDDDDVDALVEILLPFAAEAMGLDAEDEGVARRARVAWARRDGGGDGEATTTTTTTTTVPAVPTTTTRNEKENDADASMARDGDRGGADASTATDWMANASTLMRAEFEASTAERAVRRRPRDEKTVKACVERAFGVGAFANDEDALEYVASLVAADVDEAEETLEDALSAVIDAYDLKISGSVEEVCRRLRELLDERAELEICKTKRGVTPDAATGVRKLANVVKMGDDASRRGRKGQSVDAAAGLIGGSAFWEQEQRKQQLEEEERMTALAKANAEAVEQKRRRRDEKAAKAKAKARERQLEEEIQNMEQLAINAVYSKGASSRLGSRDISVSEFSMPHPRGGDDLLEGTTLSLMHGHRYGLCGRNGCGKSTLLRLLAQKRVPGIPADLRIMYVAQDSSDDLASCELTPIEVLVKSDTRRELLSKQLKELQDHEDAAVDVAIDKRIREICDELKAIGASDAHERARKVLRGLQFDAEQTRRPVASLSGGWRVRVSLARALYVNPDCLLLDEPTNHLDLEACLWLEQYICNAFDGRTLVVVSHDRSFLNAVCTDVLAVSNKKLTAYAGDYATYEAVRDEQNARQQKMYDEQQAKKKQMQKFVDKHLHKGSSSMFDDGNAKKAKEMAKKMERMGAMGHDGKKWKLSYDGAQKELTAPEVETGSFKFSFPDPGPLPSSESVQLREIAFKYAADEPAMFDQFSHPFDLTTRIALVGRNGAGKSTLMKLITGALKPTRGEIFKSGKMRIAHITQHHVEQLDMTMTPLEFVLHVSGIELSASTSPEHEQDARRRLGRFGISGSLQTQTIALLSGGQKSRVAWAVATWDEPHILLLDEPTNHLDYESVNALIDAINAFDGGVVFVSHDEFFVQSIHGARVLEITGDGAPGAVSFDDDFDAYKRKALRALKRWT